MKVTCPRCEGTGKIEEQIRLPTTLTPNQASVYRAVKQRPHYLSTRDLADLVYKTHPDGGPERAEEAIRTTVFHLNVRLKAVGERVRATHRGAGAVYFVERLNVV